MLRPLRVEYPGAVYHVTSRGNRREPIAKDDIDRVVFLSVAGEAFECFDAHASAYCLMGKHYHLVMRTTLANLSRLMRHIDGVQRKPSIAAINLQVICSRAASKPDWWTATATCSKYVISLVSIQCAPHGYKPRCIPLEQLPRPARPCRHTRVARCQVCLCEASPRQKYPTCCSKI